MKGRVERRRKEDSKGWRERWGWGIREEKGKGRGGGEEEKSRVGRELVTFLVAARPVVRSVSAGSTSCFPL